MVVLTLDRHPGQNGVIGLHIGAVNVQQYFPPDLDLVELELDHLCIVCPLEPSFWQDRPEIHDLRLSSWLESKRNSGKIAGEHAPVALIPSGARAFRLQLMADGVEPAELDHPAVAYASQIASPLSAVDRRRRSAERKPERRRIAKLKSDEQPTTAASH